jgi:hypothetical protein
MRIAAGCARAKSQLGFNILQSAFAIENTLRELILKQQDSNQYQRKTNGQQQDRDALILSLKIQFKPTHPASIL